MRKPTSISTVVLATPKPGKKEAGRGVRHAHHLNDCRSRVGHAVEALERMSPSKRDVAGVYAPQKSDGAARTAREILEEIDVACELRGTILIYLIVVAMPDAEPAPIFFTEDGGLQLNDVCEHLMAGKNKATKILMIDCLADEQEIEQVADDMASTLLPYPDIDCFAVVAPFSNWLAQILPTVGYRPSRWEISREEPPGRIRYVRSEVVRYPKKLPSELSIRSARRRAAMYSEYARDRSEHRRRIDYEKQREIRRNYAVRSISPPRRFDFFSFGYSTQIIIDTVNSRISFSRDIDGSVIVSTTTALIQGITPLEQEGVRSVNARILDVDTRTAVNEDAALLPNTEYIMAMNIGQHEVDSLLPEVAGRWPNGYLPDGALQLRAVLDMVSADGPVVRALTLPEFGPSFACHCEGEHERDCHPRQDVEFPLTTPDLNDEVWTGVLAVYHGAVAVHVQELVLPVSASARSSHGGVRARLLYRLTSDFTDVGPLADRAASVFVSGEAGGRAIVNGLPFVDNPVSISINAADSAARAARRLLYEQHLIDTPAGPRAAADAGYGKPFEQYVRDLAGLARLGWTMYNRMFADNAVFDSMSGLIRHEASARGRVPVLNVADASTVGDSGRTSVPWALVYDLPMPHDPAGEYRVCESVRTFGPGGCGGPVPVLCPESNHSGNVLCPFGFWGLSCLLEHPPRVDRLVRLVRQVYSSPGSPTLAVAVDENLAPELTARHLAELIELFTPHSLRVATVRKPLDLAEMLSSDWMDIAYLYCHGGYSTDDGRSYSANLRFGDSVIGEGDIAGWRLPGGPWDRQHWTTRKPVVVLNGCHTAEFTSSSLSNLVHAFVNRAGASAVVGTEVTVEQGAAGWATQQLLEQILSTETSVGHAIRALRWRLIGRGNTLGLAYTLHGVADLRLRPAR